MEYFTLGLTAEILSERLSIVLIGLLLHGLCFGGLLLLQQFFAPITFPAWLRAPLPYHWICPLFFRAEDKLNRADRAPTKRAWRGGAVLTATLIASWLMASIATLFFLYSLPSPYCVALLIAALLPLGYAATPLYLPNEAPSHYTVARGSYAEMVLIDDAHVRRLQLERLARALLETVLLTAGFLIAELHGLIALSLLCALYHSVSVPTTRYYAYGILIRMLYEALCFIPALVVAALCCLAGFFVPNTAPVSGINALFQHDHVKGKEEIKIAPYPAFYLRAFAAIVRVSLGGPYRCDDAKVSAPWIGKGTAQLEPQHLRTGAQLCALAIFLLLLCIAALH